MEEELLEGLLQLLQEIGLDQLSDDFVHARREGLELLVERLLQQLGQVLIECVRDVAQQHLLALLLRSLALFALFIQSFEQLLVLKLDDLFNGLQQVTAARLLHALDQLTLGRIQLFVHVGDWLLCHNTGSVHSCTSTPHYVPSFFNIVTGPSTPSLSFLARVLLALLVLSFSLVPGAN